MSMLLVLMKQPRLRPGGINFDSVTCLKLGQMIFCPALWQLTRPPPYLCISVARQPLPVLLGQLQLARPQQALPWLHSPPLAQGKGAPLRPNSETLRSIVRSIWWHGIVAQSSPSLKLRKRTLHYHRAGRAQHIRLWRIFAVTNKVNY